MTIILILLALTGCSEQQSNEQETINTNEILSVQSLVEDFILRLFPETENYKVINFENKAELTKSLTEVMDIALANEYVNKFYYEQNNSLYLNLDEEFFFIDPTKPYSIIKLDETRYRVNQEIKVSNGNYDINVIFEKRDNWIIAGTEINFEQQESEQTKINREIVRQSKDLQSNLLLVNRENQLPKDYVPEDLVEVDIPFSFTGKSEKKLLKEEAAIQLKLLINKAKEENIFIYGVSGYRSYETQEAIFTYNITKYGNEEEANKISAYPGQSEHQTGLTMDVSSSTVDYQLIEEFADTPEGKWLAENAAEFGYIIRYPKGKENITGYVYEPWHIRYVGLDTAKKITELNITLDEYIEMAENSVSD